MKLTLTLLLQQVRRLQTKFPYQIIIVNENVSSYYLAGQGASTGYMTPYGTYATLPQQGAFNGLTNLPYQNAAANASLQEARLQ